MLLSNPKPAATPASVRIFSPKSIQCARFFFSHVCASIIGAKETEQLLYRQAQIKYVDIEPNQTEQNQALTPYVQTDTHFCLTSACYTKIGALTILLTIIGIDAIIVVCRKWCSRNNVYHISIGLAFESVCVCVCKSV